MYINFDSFKEMQIVCTVPYKELGWSQFTLY